MSEVSVHKFGRMSKLVTLDALWGMENNVLIEGAFVQLTDTAESWRQVYLGLTEQEFLLATQIPSDYTKYPEVFYIVNVDPELEGLELKLVLPLKFIHFYVIEDRSRRFAVCSCTGHVYYFELCQFSKNTEEFWALWCSKIARYGNGAKLGFNIWKSEIVVSGKKGKAVKKRKLRFIRHPFPFNPVRTIGIQTENNSEPQLNSDLTENTSDSTETMPFTSHQKMAIDDEAQFAADESQFAVDFAKVARNIRCLYFVASVNFHPGHYKLGSCHIEGHSVSQTDISTKHLLDPDENMYSLAGSQSLPNLIGYRSEQKCGDTQSFCTEMENYLLTASTQKQECEKSSLPVLVTRSLCKILNFRRSQRTMDIGSSQSEVSITDIVNNSPQKSKRRYAYSKVRQDLLMKRHVALENTGEQTMFLTCKKETRPEITLQSFTPLEVATELTLLMRQMVLTMSQTSILDCCSSQHGLQLLTKLLPLKFSERVSEWVVLEILEKSDIDARIWTLHFYIQVALQLMKQKDYESASAVLRGLQLAPIARLHDMWDMLIMKMPRLVGAYLNMCTTMEEETSYQTFKKEFPTMLQSRSPFLPRISHFLFYCMELPCLGEYKMVASNARFLIWEQIIGLDSYRAENTESLESLDIHEFTLSKTCIDKLPIGSVIRQMKTLDKVKGPVMSTYNVSFKKDKAITKDEKSKKKKDSQKNKKKEKRKDSVIAKGVTVERNEKPQKSRKWFWKKKKTRISDSDASFMENSSNVILKENKNHDNLSSANVLDAAEQGEHSQEMHLTSIVISKPSTDSLEVPHVFLNPEDTNGVDMITPSISSSSSMVHRISDSLPENSLEHLQKEENVMDKAVFNRLEQIQGERSDERRRSLRNFTNFFGESAEVDHTDVADSSESNIAHEHYSNNNAYRKKYVHFQMDKKVKHQNNNKNQNQNINKEQSADHVQRNFNLGDCKAWHLLLLLQIASSRYNLMSNVKLRLYLKTHMVSNSDYSLFQMSQTQHKY